MGGWDDKMTISHISLEEPGDVTSVFESIDADYLNFKMFAALKYNLYWMEISFILWALNEGD